jgi:hypothetical protein
MMRSISAAVFAALALVIAGASSSARAETPDEIEIEKLISRHCRGMMNASAAYQQLCAASLKQGAQKGNTEFVERLETVFRQCAVGDITSPENRRAAFKIKAAVEWTLDDLATVHRYATNCSMKNDPTNFLMQSMFLTGDEVLRTYADDIATARANVRQVEAMKVEAEERRKSEDARRIALAEQGYSQISLLELKANASRHVGTKVVVNGLLQIYQNDMAYLGSRADDMTGVVVSIKDAAVNRRMDLLARCSQFARPCRTEIRGKVITSEPSVLIQAD